MATDIKKLSLSPTKVDTFLKCKRKFYYNYVNSPFPPIEHSYFIIGNVAHQALELFHKNHYANKPWNKQMSSAFREAVARQHALEKVSRGMLTKLDLFAVKEMLKNYLGFLRQGNVVNVHQLEKLVKIDIKGVPVGMKADRVDLLPGGGYSVIDYKTSQRPASKKEELASVQIPSYGLWVRQKIDSTQKIQGTYYYLRHILSKKGIHTHDVTAEWMDEAANQYVTVYSQLQNGCNFTTTIDKQVCRWCDYRLPCSTNFGFN
jgi:ATP-dependent helicase/nuclease subunit B